MDTGTNSDCTYLVFSDAPMYSEAEGVNEPDN